MMHALRGQTLIETLITILMIAAAVIALIRFQTYLAYDNSVTKEYGDAVVIANHRIELLRDFQVLNNTSGYTSYQSIASGSAVQTVNNTTYTVAWTVTPYTDPTYKSVSITVSWSDRRGNSQSVIIHSNIAGVDPAFSASIM